MKALILAAGFGTAEYHPVNLCAATKQALEDLLVHYHGARGLSVLTLKPLTPTARVTSGESWCKR